MVTQTLPRSAESYGREQRAEIRDAVAAVKRQWRRVGTEFDAGFALVAPTLLAITNEAQARVAEAAQAYVPAVLAETGQSAAVNATERVRAGSLVGLSGDGRPVESLLYGAVVTAKTGVAGGATAAQALQSSSKWLSLTVGTLLSDTGRQSESLAMGVRPVGGYVRMLNPPSCSRCVVQAGKWFRKNAGFQRHPGCDCRHIPASESIGRDLTVDPYDYFDSLTPAQQDKTFTKAGAEAIRAGANIVQVVNARRGMSTAQVGGRDIVMTREGVTRRGVAYRAMNPDRVTDRRGRGERYFSARRPRLMPETIQQVAKDRADYLRLLDANGYLG